MSIVFKMAPELRSWIAHNLDRGCRPAELVSSMVSEKFEPALARGLIDTFVRARASGVALPDGELTLDVSPPEYFYETSRLAPGNAIRTADRVIPVLLRLQQPQLALLADVLSADECDRVIELARPRLQPSTIVDPDSGMNVIAAQRSSDGMFFRPEENDCIATLEKRVSQIMTMPLEHGEGLQVLRYGPGAQSAPHFDFLSPSNAANRASLARSGQRISSLVVYLNDVAAGGETFFPEANLAVSPKERQRSLFRVLQ